MFQVDFVLPGATDLNIDPKLLQEVKQQPVYLIRNLPVAKLVDYEFIDAFVFRGKYILLYT